jgi:membrane peptidoglycan carboxypeptidase
MNRRIARAARRRRGSADLASKGGGRWRRRRALERPVTSRGRAGGRLVVGAILGALTVAAMLWFLTPSGADLEARTAAFTALHESTPLRPADIPPLLANAMVATEDEHFYHYHGVDVLGTGRALLHDVFHFCLCQGGSTITEQLVKGVHLDGGDPGLNKLVDAAVALKVETHANKQQILADYLSSVPVGPTQYGIAAGACVYFSRPLRDLSLSQYALLAGLPQAPSQYDPLLHPDAARQRRNVVLTTMQSDGYITLAQKDAASADPLSIQPGSQLRGCQ